MDKIINKEEFEKKQKINKRDFMIIETTEDFKNFTKEKFDEVFKIDQIIDELKEIEIPKEHFLNFGVEFRIKIKKNKFQKMGWMPDDVEDEV
tara:strand:- start:663 stop:938 length:276 start_codon:yes stop_codon:yes gene_type:complete